MKKFLFLFGFLLSNYFYTQNPLLFSHTWLVTKILYQSVEYPVPPIPVGYKNTTTFSSTELRTILYNGYIGQISSINDSQVVLENFGGTLMISPDENFAAFEAKYANIFAVSPLPKTFNYIVSNLVNGDYELILTDTNSGNKVYYNASLLSYKTAQNFSIKIFPNPTSDFITIENVKTNSLVKIIDTSGKVVLNKKLSGNSIDVKSLSKGTYFLKIDGLKPLKFIKK